MFKSTYPISVLAKLCALWFTNRDIAAILMEHEKWEEMLRIVDEEESTTPMRDLIAFMPGKPNHC